MNANTRVLNRMTSDESSGSNNIGIWLGLALVLIFVLGLGWWMLSRPAPAEALTVREPVLTKNQQLQFDSALTAIAGLSFKPGCDKDESLGSFAKYLLYKALTNGRVPFAADFKHDFGEGCLKDGTRNSFIQMVNDLGSKMRNWGVHSQLGEDELYAVCRWVVQQLLAKLP